MKQIGNENNIKSQKQSQPKQTKKRLQPKNIQAVISVSSKLLTSCQRKLIRNGSKSNVSEHKVINQPLVFSLLFFSGKVQKPILC